LQNNYLNKNDIFLIIKIIIIANKQLLENDAIRKILLKNDKIKK